MPSKTSKKKATVGLPRIPKEVNAASMAFKKALIERALGAELSHHLGYGAARSKPARAFIAPNAPPVTASVASKARRLV